MRKLIAGPTVYICEECVELCNDIMFEEWAAEARKARDEVQAQEEDLRAADTTGGPLEIRHTPLSLEDVPSEFIDRLTQAGYRCVCFYRTAVTNTTDRPLRIVWFDRFFVSRDEAWMASNVRNKVLRARDFTDWYGGDAMIPDGWLPPGVTVADQVNWHPAHETPTKWAYLAVDERGNDYFAEAMVPTIVGEPLRVPSHVRWRGGDGSVRF